MDTAYRKGRAAALLYLCVRFYIAEIFWATGTSVAAVTTGGQWLQIPLHASVTLKQDAAALKERRGDSGWQSAAHHLSFPGDAGG